MDDTEGTCDEQFEEVRDVLAASLDKDDVGASVAVYVDGEPVLDIWGGYADADRTHPWERDTITNVWSTTKTMTGALTQGYLIGEVVRRVTGRGLGRFFADEVAGPLGADFHIGLAAEHDHRVAAIIPARTRAPELEARGLGNPPIPPEVANTEAWRRADIPSPADSATRARWPPCSRSSRLVVRCEACGCRRRPAAVGGRLLSAAGCERVLEEQFRGEDQILGAPIRHGMGYAVQGRTCSWGGWGASIVLIDLDRHMTVSYVMNQMIEQGPLGDDRGLSVVMAAYSGASAG